MRKYLGRLRSKDYHSKILIFYHLRVVEIKHEARPRYTLNNFKDGRIFCLHTFGDMTTASTLLWHRQSRTLHLLLCNLEQATALVGAWKFNLSFCGAFSFLSSFPFLSYWFRSFPFVLCFLLILIKPL